MKNLIKILLIFALPVTQVFAETGNNQGGQRPDRPAPSRRQAMPETQRPVEVGAPRDTSSRQRNIASENVNNSFEDSATAARNEMNKQSGAAKGARNTAAAAAVAFWAAYAASVSAGSPNPTLKKSAIVATVATGALALLNNKYSGKADEFEDTANRVRNTNNAGNPNNPNNPNGPGNGSDNPNNPSGPNVDNDPEFNRLITQLRNNGVEFDRNNGNIKLPDGTRINTKRAMQNPASLSAAGLSAADIKGVQDSINQAFEKSLAGTDSGLNADIYDETMNGGGGGAFAGGEGFGADFAMPQVPEADQKNARTPANVEGLTKNFNGEPIGVAQDSLFSMIQRRYELHETRGSFILPGQ